MEIEVKERWDILAFFISLSVLTTSSELLKIYLYINAHTCTHTVNRNYSISTFFSGTKMNIINIINAYTVCTHVICIKKPSCLKDLHLLWYLYLRLCWNEDKRLMPKPIQKFNFLQNFQILLTEAFYPCVYLLNHKSFFKKMKRNLVY